MHELFEEDYREVLGAANFERSDDTGLYLDKEIQLYYEMWKAGYDDGVSSVNGD